MLNPTTHTLRPAMSADLPQVADLDHEAFAPYGTVEARAEIVLVESREQITIIPKMV